MIKIRRCYLLISLFSALACNPPKTIEGFENAGWKKDKMACSGIRERMATDFEQVRKKLIGLSQDEIIDVLGMPDLQRLDTRNQKFFLYYVAAGNQCQDGKVLSVARKIAVRFNATGYVSEVTYQQGP